MIINHPYSLDEIVTALRRANPSKKQTEAACIAKWHRYERLFAECLEISIIKAPWSLIEENRCYVAWDQLTKKLGECRKFGDYLSWFHQHYPLVKIIHKGNNLTGRLTMIEPLFPIEIAATSQTPQEAFLTLYQEHLPILKAWVDSDFEMETVDWVPIDVRSLRAFIQSNIKETETATRANHIDTLKINLVWAQSIIQVAEHWAQYGEPGIPQIVNESEFGRKYYKGLNLQNAPRVVRHAALGHCYQYDLNASVFAWRLTEARRIQPGIKLPATVEYLDEKEARREQLAHALDLPISHKNKKEIIKTLITAIGFGVRPSNAGVSWVDSGGTRHYPAISKIIKSPQARKQILANPWLVEFIEEQKLISRIIFDHHRSLLPNLECLRSERDNLSVNKCLAYLYQQEERRIIDILTKDIRESGNLLLMVHDGFYTKRPEKLLLMKERLIQLNPEADISRDEHTAWGFDEDIEAHRKLILEQERKANNGFIPSNILANYNRIEYQREGHKEYMGSDEYDAGYRPDPKEYDLELDPFYD